MQLPPLSLYVHLPWCVAKCPYCDFNSHPAGTSPPRQRYVSALVADLAVEAASSAIGSREIATVFIGGGTPSLFSGEEIQSIMDNIRQNLSLSADAEITMEANPGTVERGNLRAYRNAGINRLSLGAQSFDAASLQRLGRIHGPDEIVQAFDAARRGGFDNINLDLMFALPGQDKAMATEDVERAIGLRPEHISYYQLTLEPNTVFHARPPVDLPDDDLAWEIQERGQYLLQQAGYEQYEVSAFARPNRRSRHNLNYWCFGDYLAIGAGAHGKLTDSEGRIHRYRKPAHPQTYIEQSERQELQNNVGLLTENDLVFEYMLNILRLTEGFATSGFTGRTGLPANLLDEALQRSRGDGLLLTVGDDYWRPTPLGFRFLNDLQARFLPD